MKLAGYEASRGPWGQIRVGGGDETNVGPGEEGCKGAADENVANCGKNRPAGQVEWGLLDEGIDMENGSDIAFVVAAVLGLIAAWQESYAARLIGAAVAAAAIGLLLA